MMQVLQFIAKNDNTLDYISMLPLAGYDGTLQYRGGLHEAGLDGKVSAKTGSLQGVYNLAGFITTSSGARVAFVQFLSGYAVRRKISVPAVFRWCDLRAVSTAISIRTTDYSVIKKAQRSGQPLRFLLPVHQKRVFTLIYQVRPDSLKVLAPAP